MDLQLKAKTALVTGSTAGIGLATAIDLAREGAVVVINGRTAARVEQAILEIRRQVPGAELRGFAGDLTQASEAARLTREFPEVEILVNNLGVYESKALEEITDQDWSRMFDANVVSGARLSQAYLPSMRKKNWGRIIFVATEAAVNVPKDMIHYGVSKAAQIALARGLAETTAGTGVTVNSVLPGPTRSEGASRFLESVVDSSKPDAHSEFLKTLRPTSLLQRFAESEEVSALVTYLASPRSAATNGAAVRVEGGLLRNTL